MADEVTQAKPAKRIAKEGPQGQPPPRTRIAPVLAIRREAPPASSGGRGNRSQYDDALAAAQAEPGEWFVLIDSAQHSGTGADAMRRRGCEITVRRNDDGSWKVWYRFPVNGTEA